MAIGGHLWCGDRHIHEAALRPPSSTAYPDTLRNADRRYSKDEIISDWWEHFPDGVRPEGCSNAEYIDPLTVEDNTDIQEEIQRSVKPCLQNEVPMNVPKDYSPGSFTPFPPGRRRIPLPHWIHLFTPINSPPLPATPSGYIYPFTCK